MKNSDPPKNNKINKVHLASPDFTSPDINSDKAGPESDANKKVKKQIKQIRT